MRPCVSAGVGRRLGVRFAPLPRPNQRSRVKAWVPESVAEPAFELAPERVSVSVLPERILLNRLHSRLSVLACFLLVSCCVRANAQTPAPVAPPPVAPRPVTNQPSAQPPATQTPAAQTPSAQTPAPAQPESQEPAIPKG